MEKIFSLSLMAVLVFVCIVAVSQEAPKQASNDNNNKTLHTKQITVKETKKRSPNPRVAAIASAAIPGLGQIYNQKYWKAPLVWGIGLGFYAYIDKNNTLYNSYKQACDQFSKEQVVINEALSGEDYNHLVYYRDRYGRQKDLAIIYAGVFYFANIVDALVDAYLFDYDISNNLALHWEPKITTEHLNTNYTLNCGLNVQLRF